MKKERYRKFLPSILPIDLTMANCTHVETGFLAGDGHNYTKFEKFIELFPGGMTFAKMSLVVPYKGTDHVTGARIPEEDADWLLDVSNNKIKKYMYHLKHGEIDVYVNRYTLGVVTIDIDALSPILSLPEYCGVEVTDKVEYNELYLTEMREQLKAKKINKK